MAVRRQDVVQSCLMLKWDSQPVWMAWHADWCTHKRAMSINTLVCAPISVPCQLYRIGRWYACQLFKPWVDQINIRASLSVTDLPL